MKHTPGIWEARQTRGNNIYEYEYRVSTIGKTIADIDGDDAEENKANAALIAACPDMLDALKMIVAAGLDTDRVKLPVAHWRQIEAAIAKATGGD